MGYARRGKGYTVNEKGYIRITKGPNRDKYAHRVVIEGLLGGPIPDHMTVDHMDHNKQHNCPGNLLLLEKVIHDAISWCSITPRYPGVKTYDDEVPF